VGYLLARLFNVKLVCEFQDPLLGATMNRSQNTRTIASLIESWLVKSEHKVIFVTKAAAKAAQNRNQKHKLKIQAVYPSSWNFNISQEINEHGTDGNIEFLHLGTLYDSRNLDLFFKALDNLKKRGFRFSDKVRITNLGSVYCNCARIYEERPDYLQINEMSRIEALTRARKSTYLLLIQHKDDRSLETIPYKTYDYLNLGLPILGLLKNPELAELIKLYGGISAESDYVKSIEAALEMVLSNVKGHSKLKNTQSESFNIFTQFKTILD
jgi:hypothetical protein